MGILQDLEQGRKKERKKEENNAMDGTCPRQEVSGNTSGEFVIRTDFLPYILRIPVSGYFLPGTSMSSLP